MECPKCAYVRTADDTHVMVGLCPQCGIAYAKWHVDHAQTERVESGLNAPERVGESLISRLWLHLSHVPENTDIFDFGWRCAIYLAFMFWGAAFIVHGVDWAFIGDSFLHNINLPFHEFGHVLFSPFGRFLSILGGSLFQILMPLIAMGCFIVQMRDNFAASIMLWWAGQNFIDVSPYIADAPHRALPLIRGLGEEYHDWGNLLSELDALEYAQSIATVSFTLGTLVMMMSGMWGFALLRQYYKNQLG